MSDHDASIARIQILTSTLEWLENHHRTLKGLLVDSHWRIVLLKQLIEEEKAGR